MSTAPETQERIHFASVALDGFRGHHLRIPLAPVTVLAGPNMTGKTSARDAMSLCLTGNLPGVRPDSQSGLAPTEALSDCAPASGAFRVEATDSAGVTLAFAFSTGKKGRGFRNLTSTLSASRRNEEHVAAIWRRYGAGEGPLGMVALDLEALRRLPADGLERALLELCGSTAPDWTVQRLLDELATRSWDEWSEEEREAMPGGGESSEGLVTFLGDVAVPAKEGESQVKVAALTDVREAIKDLVAPVEARITANIGTVRRLKTEVELKIPDAPGGEQVEELRKQRDAAAGSVQAASERVGHARERIEAKRQAADEERERISKQRGEVTEELQDVERRLESVRAEKEEAGRRKGARAKAAEEAEAKAAAAKNKLQELDDTRPCDEALSPSPEFAEAAERAEARVRELEGAEPPALPEEHADREKAADEEWSAAVEARSQAHADCHRQRAVVAGVETRQVRYADGRCPECGKPAEDVQADLAAELASAVDALADRENAEKAADERVKRAEAERQECARLRKENEAARKEHAFTLRSAQQARDEAREALTQAEQNARDDAAQAKARWERQRAEASQSLEAAQRTAQEASREAERSGAAVERLTSVEEAVADQLKRLKERAEALPELPPPFEVPADLQEVLTAAEEALAAAKDKHGEAQEAHEDALAKRREADSIRDRVRRAKDERETARLRTSAWKATLRHLFALEREVLGAYLEPLAKPVNELLELTGTTARYGRLEAVAGERFQLGFRQGEDFAPLSQLSDGHLAAAMALLVTAIHDLAGTTYRGLHIDRAEALDHNARGSLLYLLSFLQAEGNLDQVVLGAVAEEGELKAWRGAAPNVEVVDMRECTTEDTKAAEAA